MAELSTTSYSDFVSLEKIMFEKGAEMAKNYMMESGIVNVMQIDENSGNTRKFTGMDTNQYLTYKGEDEQAARATFVQDYSKTMTAYRVAENFSISYEMRTQNKYPEVMSKIMNEGKKGYNTMDLDLSHRITFAASTSYTAKDGRTIATTTGDGFAFAYTAHTLNGSSTTFRNILANNPQLSKGALEAMERMINENTYSPLGEKAVVEYDILWINNDPVLVNTAREYLYSTADVEGAHAGITNVYKNKYNLVILPKVATDAAGANDTTKRAYWGLASSQMKPIFLGIWEAPHSEPANANGNSEDVQTDAWEFRNRAGYGIVTPSPLGFCLSKGDASS